LSKMLKYHCEVKKYDVMSNAHNLMNIKLTFVKIHSHILNLL